MGTWSWTGPTRPFVDSHGREPARFVFEQVDDDGFVLQEGFRYEPDGADASAVIEVSSRTLVTTDLASIPLFMAWFVPVNGRHTPAALVHDQLVEQSKAPTAPPAARADADDVFLQAMAATDVAILRRHLMHTAVTAATRWTSGVSGRLGMALWAMSALAGTALLVWAVATGQVGVAVAAALAPVLGALLWGRRNVGQGLLAGYAVWVIGGPALACIVGYGIYWVAEQLVRSVAARGRGTSRSDVPRPAPFR
jgi:hypothetical protein